MFTREEFLNQKEIARTVFTDFIPDLLSPLEAHSAFVHSYFYSKPYLKDNAKRTSGIPRFYHGMAHVNRVASYISVLANLYKRHCYKEAMQLDDRKLKLLQIAALFHDAGREGDGDDLWDQDSATLLYFYLQKLAVAQDEARFFAEVIANKDAEEGCDYMELHLHEDGRLSWEACGEKPKNIYQVLLHDADCLDIIRARDHFDATYLDFYQLIAKKKPIALDEMAQLITEVRSVIAKQGDNRFAPDHDIKAKYEKAQGIKQTNQLFNDSRYRVLPQLFNNGRILTKKSLKKLTLVDAAHYDATNGLGIDNVRCAMQEGKLFARSLTLVSAIAKKKITKADGSIEERSLADIDIIKAARRKGVATSSSKWDRENKQGNPNRSISMLGYGASVFSDVGFLLVNPSLELMTSISVTDANTGWYKKQEFTHAHLTLEQKQQQRAYLVRLLKLGGSSHQFKKAVATHNELTCNIEAVDAIYFSRDPNFRNYLDTGTYKVVHPHAPLLKAIYLQDKYRKYHGVTLPIFEYSSLHNSIRSVPEEEYSHAKIIEMWTEVVRSCLNKAMNSNNEMIDILDMVANLKVDELKVRSVYGINQPRANHHFIDYIGPPDVHHVFLSTRRVNMAINHLLAEWREKNLDCLGRLLVAVFEDDVDGVRDNFVSMTVQDLDLYKVMLAAISASSNNVLDWLANRPDRDVIFNSRNFYGCTSLYYAIGKSTAEMVNYLLEHGAQVDAIDQDGVTPLMLAISFKKMDCIKALLAKGANVDAVDRQEQSVLAYAALQSSPEIVDLLLQYRADPNQLTCSRPRAILFDAISGHEYDVATYLINEWYSVAEHYPVHIDVMLEHFSGEDRVSFKEKLLSFCESTSSRLLMLTPLQWALYCGDTYMTEFLLERGAVFNTNDAGDAIICQDYLPEIGSLFALLLQEVSLECQWLLADNIAEFIREATVDDPIDSIVTSPGLMNFLFEQNASILPVLANLYWQQYKQPLTITGKIRIEALLSLESGRHFIHCVNDGKLVGFEQDEHGRYVRDGSEHFGWHSKYFDGFNKQDFTRFNFLNFSFEQFSFQETRWRFFASDHSEFNRCIMDGFSVTSDSDLSNIMIKDPIFSSTHAAAKVANLFETIPLFMLKREYLSEIKSMLKTGKRFQYGSLLNDRMHELIKNNEYELFREVFTSLLDELQESHVESFLIQAIASSHCDNFMNFVLQTYDLTNPRNVMKNAAENMHLAAIYALLAHGYDANGILSCGNIIGILYGLLDLSISSPKVYFSQADQAVPFYSLVERLLYLCAYLSEAVEIVILEESVTRLIDELLQLYIDHKEGVNVKERALALKEAELSLLALLKSDHLLLRKAKEVNDRGINRFYSYTVSSGLIINHVLTGQDMQDLCAYLHAHPDVDNVYFYNNNFDVDSLHFLVMVSSVKKLYFHQCRLNDESAAVFAVAPYLVSLKIDEGYREACMSEQGLKLVSSNLNLKKIVVGYDGQLEGEAKQWATIMSEKDPLVRTRYGDEVRAYYAEQQKVKSQQLAISARKFSVLNEHVTRLEVQLAHVGHGKRGRHKHNALQSQLSFFRNKIEEMPNEVCHVMKQSR